MVTVKERAMQDAPASAETTYTLSVGEGFEGWLEGRTDQDWVRVELVAGRSYDIRLTGIGYDGIDNTYLRVFNSVGEEVAFNDDVDAAAWDLSSMVEFSPETGGIYYLSAGIYPYTGLNTIGGYLMTLTDEEDNSTDTPHTVSPDGRFSGTLDSKFDEDWIRVDLVEGKTYTITLAGVGPDADTDTILKLYDSGGGQVAFHDDLDYAAGKVNSVVTFTPVVTGAYYIGAGAYRGNPNQDNSGHYQVTVYDEEVAAGLTLTGTEEDDARHNKLIGGPGDDVLDGGDGFDWLEGGAGADVILGGDDGAMARYRYSDAGVEVNLEDGTARGGHAEGDTFPGEDYYRSYDANGELVAVIRVSDTNSLFGSAYDDILVGSLVGNRLYGYYGDDELDGREGDDVLSGGPGADVLRGGPGIDVVNYLPSDSGVEVRLHDGTARGGDAEGDTFPGTMKVEYTDLEGNTQIREVPDIEHLYGSTHDDVLVGTHGDNFLSGAAGNDVLDGREGNDVLFGGPGADVLRGGDGGDWVSYFDSDSAVEVHLHDGTARGGDAEGDTFPGTMKVEYTDLEGNTQIREVPDIEHLYGSTHDDVLVGTHRDNFLSGAAGNDVLDGREGNDVLSGGPGADAFRGGPGIDVVNYLPSDSGVEVRLHDGTARGGDAEGDTFPGRKTVEYIDNAGVMQTTEVSDIEFLNGSLYDDILVGDRGDNRIEGVHGNDELDGREGDDLLAGEVGADIIKGGKGIDTASYYSSDSGVLVRLHNDTVRGGDAEGDTLTGIENLTGSDYADILAGDLRDNKLMGGGGNDVLYGGPNGGDDSLMGETGDDKLYGGIGNDTLEGGSGNDQLRGGPDDDMLDGGEGDDVFFIAAGGGNDTILDFGNGEDTIDLAKFADIQSVEDLDMQQQETGAVIDLSAQGGGTVTLQGFDMADLMDAHFVFFIGVAAEVA